jgi:hypothetical protein
MKTLTLPSESEVYTITGTEWLNIGISSMLSPISFDEAVEKDKNIENGLFVFFFLLTIFIRFKFSRIYYSSKFQTNSIGLLKL